MEELDEILSHAPPIWAIFGDLMSGLVGVFVLLLVWTLGFQLELSQSLKEEVNKRKAEEQRRMALENALADPLAQGRVTLEGGRIGISGSILFLLNSAQLQPEGRELLQMGDRDVQRLGAAHGQAGDRAMLSAGEQAVALLHVRHDVVHEILYERVDPGT